MQRNKNKLTAGCKVLGILKVNYVLKYAGLNDLWNYCKVLK